MEDLFWQQRDSAQIVLRLLHCIHSLDPAGGGPANFIGQLIAAQIRSAAPVSSEVLSLDCPDASYLKDFPAAVKALGPGWGNYGYTSKLHSWLRANCSNYDLVIIHGLWQYSSWGAYRALANSGTPYVVFPHGMLDPWFNQAYPIKRLKKALYWNCAESQVLKNARAVIFTAEDEMTRARMSFRPYECNEVVSSLGTEKPPGDSAVNKAKFLQRFPILADKRILLFLGRLHEKKGVDILISAFAGSNPDESWHLLLAGPGSQKQADRIAQQCRELNGRVSLCGMLTGGEKWGALQASEVLALPSHQENFALSVSEALSCATPVLISNRVNTWRYIQEAQAGFVEADNFAGTKKLLERWMALQPEDRAIMSKNALHCYQRWFDIDVVAARMTELFRNYARKPDAIYDV